MSQGEVYDVLKEHRRNNSWFTSTQIHKMIVNKGIQVGKGSVITNLRKLRLDNSIKFKLSMRTKTKKTQHLYKFPLPWEKVKNIDPWDY